ncbi:hypothetical protein ACXR6G_19445 [Ancylomarina sp. YFZ004]
MGLFGKSKKSSCCAVQFEEVKEDKDKKSSCCDIKIEELKEDDKYENSDSGCCGD